MFLQHCYSYRGFQFQAAAASEGDANTNRERVDGKKSGQSQRLATVLPVFMTQDHLTMAVLTLLLGGWLVVALTFPIVSLISACLQ